MPRGRRLVVWTSLSTTVLLTMSVMWVSSSTAESSNPPRPSGSPDDRSRFQGSTGGRATIDAIVVKSWGSCDGSSLIWRHLDANWANYGSTPISIDYSYPGLCSKADDVTLAELHASGADVVIVSDPSGGLAQWSSDDAQALQQFADEGHNVIGTFLLLQFADVDNRALAPVFGLNPALTYGGADTPIRPIYVERYPAMPLFRDVGNPYLSSGHDETQTPSDGRWSANELSGARIVATTPKRLVSRGSASILVSRGAAYYSIYVTSMPEYNGSTVDAQFFYNAIIFPSIPKEE